MMHPARQAYVEEDVPEVSYILKMLNSLSCVHMVFFPAKSRYSVGVFMDLLEKKGNSG